MIAFCHQGLSFITDEFDNRTFEIAVFLVPLFIAQEEMRVKTDLQIGSGKSKRGQETGVRIQSKRTIPGYLNPPL